jgi:methanogenic corrinoid protein MtbC1
MVVAEKIDTSKAIDVMTTAIREVGEGFRGGYLFLPDLVGAADNMSAAMPYNMGRRRDS